MKRTTGLLVAAAIAAVGVEARAQTQIKSRVLVLLDTSGSMGFHFKDPTVFGNPPNGDYPGGDGSFSYTDGNLNNAFMFPGKQLVNPCTVNTLATNCDGPNSRLYAAKHAITNAINGYGGDIDFGLETFDFQLCAFASPLCEQCRIQCIAGNCFFNCLYADNAFTKLVSTNWVAQACTNGGRIIVLPGAGSGVKVLPWLDGVEDHRTSNDGNNAYGTGSTPLNPEVRAEGATPLAQSIDNARTGWYDMVKGGDPQLNCRPYALVLVTDGSQSGGTCAADPVASATALYNDNAQNHVLTYVIGVSSTPADQVQLNAIAAAGGTKQATFANDQPSLEAAFANIAAASVKVEICNGADDNCNALIDEGLGVYQECTQNAQCASGVCSQGRCTCPGGNAQCAQGYRCAKEYGGVCVPGCSTGVGACLRTGVEKCGANNGPATCCVDDGNPACVPLVAGMPGMCICNGVADNNCNGIVDSAEACCQNGGGCTPQAETCNGKDDDCDNIIDDNLVDVNLACGLNIGVCMPGKTVCVNSMNQDVTMKGVVPDAMDKLVCQGGTQPQPLACNGCDNNCDGVVDSPQQACYDGPNGTQNVGICHGGLQQCCTGGGANDPKCGGALTCTSQPKYGTCVGEQLPQMEICNGLDDDCNGKVDDVMGANAPCGAMPSMACVAEGNACPCKQGTMQCSGGGLTCVGVVGPTPETCDGIDNDCNGKIDDLPNLGNACVPQMGCSGILVCDPMQKMVICQPKGMGGGLEICNGKDDDCDGVPDEPADVCKNDRNICDANGNPLPCGPVPSPACVMEGMPTCPCVQGKTICKNGMASCDGAVGPSPEVCDGIDNDCDGNVDNMAPCPPQFACYRGQCDPLCQAGEFPCPGGYTCVMGMGLPKEGICVADKDCNPPCANGMTCNTQTGMCEDLCQKVTCNPPFKCDQGVCYGCEHGQVNPAFACGQCQLCDKGSHACVADKCCNVKCDQGQFCDQTTGMCVGTCANGCPTGQICENGSCVADKCANRPKPCGLGTVCDPKTGDCVQDPCLNQTCGGTSLVCCQGTCKNDPCAGTTCPANTTCHVNALTCGTSCDAVPVADRDQIVGAGGGGFACAAAPGRPSAPDGALALLALVGLVFARRRRAEEVK